MKAIPVFWWKCIWYNDFLCWVIEALKLCSHWDAIQYWLWKSNKRYKLFSFIYYFDFYPKQAANKYTLA